MSLFAIADLHLSLGTDKPMDIFNGWNDYTKRLENNWRAIVSENDTVVIAGDISWAMKLEDSKKDFDFINNLPGKKIILKGNHDYWWETRSKIDRFLDQNQFNTISILHNCAYKVDNFAICGSRGWFYDSKTREDKKILAREVGRLQTSIDSAKKLNLEPVVFLHYPPIYNSIECKEIMDVLINNGIKKCYFGHIHGKDAYKKVLTGVYKDIYFNLISCDYLSFTPLLVR